MPEVTTGINNLEFPQVSAILAEIVSQASGQKTIAPLDSAGFVSVAQTALLSGYDPVIQSISQVLSRTIFSIRPYYSKLRGLRADSIRYGNHVRKLQVVDGPVEDDKQLEVCNPEVDMDMYKAPCPKVLQTNFYGQTSYSIPLKIFRDQLNTAFSGPEEFARFISMLMTNVTSQMEQIRENTARAALVNFIGGKITANAPSVIHALTEYNNLTGAGLTATTVYLPANFADFVRWLYARINTASDKLTERSYLYHVNIEGKPVQRHTPKDRQKVYMFVDFINSVDALVRTVNYDNSFMCTTDFEKIGFWQDIQTPDSINITPVYMDENGVLQSPAASVQQDNIIGMIFDEEAVGYTEINQWSAPTPFNNVGGFSVIRWHFTERYWNDFTENGIIVVLD